MKLFLIYRLLKKIASYQQNDNNDNCFEQKKFQLFADIFLPSSWIDLQRKGVIFSSLPLASIKEYFYNFHKKDLERLLNIIEKKGMILGDCIFSPQFSQSALQKCQSITENSQELVHLYDDSLNIQILLCILFNVRHFEILSLNKTIKLLRPLPWCSHHLFSFDDQFIPKRLCLNPFHWTVLIPNDPHYCVDIGNIDNYYWDITKQHEPIFCSETATIHTTTDEIDNNSKWCILSYWEFRMMVVSNIKVQQNCIDIHGIEQLNNEWPEIELLSLSLPKLSALKHTNNVHVDKTIINVGMGVKLFLDPNKNDVWLYNRSTTSAIFVESSFLSSNRPIKVLPGHLLKAFDCDLSRKIKNALNLNHSSCLYSSNLVTSSFRFSFVKGFGLNYKRQEIMQCPCWIEVILFL